MKFVIQKIWFLKVITLLDLTCVRTGWDHCAKFVVGLVYQLSITDKVDLATAFRFANLTCISDGNLCAEILREPAATGESEGMLKVNF